MGRTVGLLLIPVLVIGPTAADGVDEPDPATVAAQQAAAAEFFDWPTPESIGDLAPGTVLDTREVPVTVGAGESSSLLTLPLTASQIMYRTTDVLGRPSAAVTTVLRPTGVPELADSIIGVSQGGLMVTPEHNLDYVAESSTWSGVAGMALIGMARAYGVDLDTCLTEGGRRHAGLADPRRR